MVKRALLSGEFERLLRRLNPDLHIYCGDASNRPAGLYLVKNGQIIELGGVDKNFVPDQTIIDKQGRIVKKGWRAVLLNLVAQRIVRYADAVREIPELRERVEPVSPEKEEREIDKAVAHFKEKRPEGKYGPVYTRKDLMEIGDACNG